MMLSVIFVDDEEKVLRGIKRSLRSHTNSWDIDFAQSGHEALGKFQMKKYSAIVSDMMMPEMSGEELLGIIQKKYPHTARIVLSGHCNQETAFRLVGSDHFYLAKPCPTELLISTIENASLLAGKREDKEDRKVSAQEVQGALCDFVKLLLMRGVLGINDVPHSIKCWLPETTLKAFAPIAGEYDDFVSQTDFSKTSQWPEHKRAPQDAPYTWDDYFKKT